MYHGLAVKISSDAQTVTRAVASAQRLLPEKRNRRPERPGQGGQASRVRHRANVVAKLRFENLGKNRCLEYFVDTCDFGNYRLEALDGALRLGCKFFATLDSEKSGFSAISSL